MANKKPALHEVLAVVGDLKGAKDKIKIETENTFRKNVSLFQGSSRRLEMFEDSRKQEEMSESKSLTTTVMEKLTYMKKSFIKFWDAKVQKEGTAQLAQADIVVDGETLATNIPVYFLLELETELKELRRVLDAIPTLAQGPTWIEDPTERAGVYKAQDSTITMKTEKRYQHNVMVPATEHHPAQVREWTEDVPVGRYVADQWSGMMSSAEKSALIARLDKLYRAVKKARQRANTQEVVKGNIGAVLFKYILGE